MNITQNWQELEAGIAKIVAKAWIDEEFRNRFISKPTEIMRETGLVIDDFVKVIVNQNSADAPMLQAANGGAIYEINLPPKPEHLIEEKMSMLMQKVVDFAPSFRGCC